MQQYHSLNGSQQEPFYFKKGQQQNTPLCVLSPLTPLCEKKLCLVLE